MATTYGSWKTITVSSGSATRTFQCRSWINYSTSQTNTKYVVTVSAGYQTQNTNPELIVKKSAMGSTMYLTATGQTTVSKALKDYETIPNGTHSRTVILARDFSWNKTTSSASKTLASYLDSSYKASQAITVPALPRTLPVITNIVADRCTSAGILDDEGEYAKISFKWSVDTRYYTNVGVSYSVAAGSSSATGSLSGTSGTTSAIVSASSSAATVTVQVTDSFGTATKTGALSSANFPLDINATGTAVGILRPAPDDKAGFYTGYLESDNYIRGPGIFDNSIDANNKVTISLGDYYAVGLLTSTSRNLYFTIPTGRIFPSGTTVSGVTFSAVARAGKSNGTGAYIFSRGSDNQYGSVACNSAATTNFVDYAAKPKSITSSMWTKTLYGGTNVGIVWTGSEDHFFTGNSDNTAIINNQPVVIALYNISIELTLPTQ